MVQDTAAPGLARHPGQQHRHQHVAPIHRFPAERWDAVIAINLSSSFHTIKHAAAHEARRLGRIINIASSHGLVASADRSPTSRQARHRRPHQGRRARDRAHEGHLQRDLPGLGADAAGAKQIDARAAEKIPLEEAKIGLLSEKQPSLEFVTPEQIGELAVFLCSDAAAQIRGSRDYSIDGGWTAQ
jgi:3-hydroxybutyrate dehydrogenase